MARFSRLEVLRTLLDTGLVPVFYHGDADVAIDVARASRRGGARILEFTHRGDMAHRVFEDLIQRCAAEVPDLVLGVGSVREPHTAALYLAAGANFVVSPLVDEGLARLCNGRKVALIPGCGTTTEVARAEELGCEICKVFPGDCVGGPNFVKAVRGPSPWSSLMPTGGVQVTAESIGAWVDAGAVAVGVGSALMIREARAKAGGRS
jgi:2-dehydro-3-deoxyphosphogluconate aldolase/(4S)-4-hydroxy-2-oxoglutarate aldolase